jgi:uncharacterized membrane protein
MPRANVLALLACCAYPVLAHAAATLNEPRWAALGLTLVAWAILRGLQRPLPAVLLGGVICLLTLGLANRYPDWLLSAPPVAINLALCALFGATLRGGHEPLVSRFARIVRGTLAPELAAYTRRLTWAWTVFFAVIALASLGLALFASKWAWSLFTNVVSPLLVGLFFLGEHVYRRVRFRNYPHAPPQEVIRRIRASSVFAPRPGGGTE